MVDLDDDLYSVGCATRDVLPALAALIIVCGAVATIVLALVLHGPRHRAAA